MNVKSAKEVAAESVSVEGANGVRIQWLVGPSDAPENFCMRLFEVSKDGNTPKHSHDWEHEIFVHAGRGVVFNRGAWSPIEAGSYIFIPAGEAHWHGATSNTEFSHIFLQRKNSALTQIEV